MAAAPADILKQQDVVNSIKATIARKTAQIEVGENDKDLNPKALERFKAHLVALQASLTVAEKQFEEMKAGTDQTVVGAPVPPATA